MNDSLPMLLSLGAGALALASLTLARPRIGLLAILATVIVGQTLRVPVGEEAAVLASDVVVPLVLVAWLAGRAVRRAPALSLAPLTRPVAAVLAAFMLSFLGAVLSEDFSQRELIIAGLYLGRLATYLLTFVFARDVLRTLPLARWLAWGAGVVGAVAVLGFVQVVVLPDFSRFVPQGWDPHMGRLLSTWYDPNFVAGLFLVGALLAMAVLVEPGAGHRRGAAAVLAVSAAALILTFSRSGYAGFAAGFAVLALARARHFLAPTLLIALLLFALVPRVQERVIGVRTFDETAQLRLVSWRNALAVSADHPWLGVGYNTYRAVQVRYGFQEDAAAHAAGGSDSSLLTVLVTTGAVGLVAYGAYLVRLLAVAWQGGRRGRQPLTRAYGYGTLAAFAGLIMHGQFVNGLLFPHLLIVMAVLLGWLLGVRDSEASAWA